jgi:hypothetical protein
MSIVVISKAERGHFATQTAQPSHFPASMTT